MKYLVIRPFNELGVFKRPGDYVEVEDYRAAQLRSMGLIGGRYQEPIETAVPKKSVRKAIKRTKE